LKHHKRLLCQSAVGFVAILLLVSPLLATDPASAQAPGAPPPTTPSGSGPSAAPEGNTAAPSAPAAPTEQPPPAPTGFWERSNLLGDMGGLRTFLDNYGITFGLQEQSEIWGNTAGGLHQAVTYNGLTTPSLKIDLGKLMGWTDATFFIDAFQIHGRGPSANLVGNMQLVSNIEATRATKLYDLWLEANFLDKRLNVRVGQEGANDEMMITQYGALFLNSSFGFPALPASDLPSGGPNYPMATPFVRVKYNVGGGFTLVGSVYNGDPAPPGTGDPQLRDASGTAFRLDAHALAFAELWYSPTREGALPATYKLGAWFHSGQFADQYYDTAGVPLASPASNGTPREDGHSYAVYGIIDQMVWRRPGTQDQGIGLFLQVMGAPDDRNICNVFVEAGMNWKAPFPGRDSDVFGLAFTYEGISPWARKYSQELAALNPGVKPYATNETVVEATYLYQVTPWLTLQPDLQYVLNPGAYIPSTFSSKPLKNAFIVGVRATVTF
jgi:porin